MKRFRSFLQKRKASREARKQQPISTATEPQRQPEPKAVSHVAAANTANTLTIALQNQTNSNTVYAYITGLAIDNGNRLVLIQSDGVTPYYPPSPSGTIQPLGANCAIRLGAPGSTIQARIPVSTFHFVVYGIS